MVWHNGSVLVSIIEVINLHRARLVLGCPGSIPGAGHLSRYVFSYPGQLSLAVLSWESAVSTSQRTATPCGWGVKAGTVRVWVAGKTGWSPCYIRAIYERFRDKGLKHKALYKFVCLCFTFLLCDCQLGQYNFNKLFPVPVAAYTFYLQVSRFSIALYVLGNT